MKSKKAILTIIVLFLSIPILYKLYNFEYMDLVSQCSNKLFIQHSNISFSVKGYVRNCGATTDYSTMFMLDEDGKQTELLAIKGDRSDSCIISLEAGNIYIDCSGVYKDDVFIKNEKYKSYKVIFRNLKP